MLPAIALSLALQTQLAKDLDAILAGPEAKGAVVSVYFGRASGDTIYEHGADTHVIPASNEKVFTAVYALDALGPDWQPHTRFWKDGQTVTIDAPGDPAITSAQLQAIRAKLAPPSGAKAALHQAFNPGYGPAWEYDDLPYTYAAPIHAFSFDDATFELQCVKGDVVSLPAYLGVKSDWRASKGAFSARMAPFGTLLQMVGTVPSGDRSLGSYPIPDPSAAACRLVAGEKTDGQVPVRGPDAEIVGPRLAELLKSCLKPSDNVYAEHIFLMAASQKHVLKEDAYADAETDITTFLEGKAGVAPDSVHPVDGSGLSRHNLATARALAQVLRYAWSHGYGPTLFDSLPKPGEGTLKNRLQGEDLVAKTGTVSSVTSLSGYLHPGTADPIVFSIVFNHSLKPASVMRALQDRLVRAVAAANP